MCCRSIFGLSLDTRQGRGYGGAVMMVIRADHAGLEPKETLKAWRIQNGQQVLDFGSGVCR